MESGGNRLRVVFGDQGLYADYQFTQAERFPQVIVCTQFEPLHDIVHTRPGTQEKDRHLFVGTAYAANHFETVDFRHHHVGNDQCRRLPEELPDPV